MKLSLKNIEKKYSLKTVLNGVNVEFNSGKIYALLGENGAGKSTLADIICGAKQCSAGKIFINEKEVFFKNQKESLKHGIICVKQRPLLAEELSIKENILLGTDFPILFHSNKKIEAKINELCKDWNIKLNLNAKIWQCSGAIRFYTSFISAIILNPSFLILDEPAALLSKEERNELLKNLKKFVLENPEKTVLMITHNLADAKTYADKIIFMQEGQIVSKTSENYKMPILNSEKKVEEKSDFIEFKNINALPENRPALFEVNIKAAYGNVTLIQGQKGSGIVTLENIITGMETQKCSGTFCVHKKGKTFCTKIEENCFTTKNLRFKQKTAIISSDRNFRASNPNLSVKQLLCAMYNGKDCNKYAQKLIDETGINISANESVSNLSGGMLQQLLLRRELNSEPEVFIMCEPLQGLDSNAALKMCKMIKEYAQKGNVVIILTISDFPKELCDKIYTLQGGFCLES